ncbi:Muscle M-line assembly protein unc-89 [Eufriesea mexicana]|nr:Muscle M-line assembly protein unc-89 [Eufriesea mexicana]
MSEAEDASGKGSNLTAVEAISARLAEVTRLAEKLDARLCEAGARTRPVAMSSSAMSSTSSLFSSSNATAPVSGQIQTICSGIPGSIAVTVSSVGITAPLISSSVSTVQLQPKCVSTILFSSSMANNENAMASRDTASGLATSMPVNGTVCTGAVGEKVSPTVMESGKVEVTQKEDRETGERSKKKVDLYGTVVVDEKSKEEVAEDVNEKSFDDSLAEDSNMEGYVTATECSITPTARSRSESFVTSPECEDLAAPATVTSTCDTWWNMEEPKFLTANAAMSSAVIKQMEVASKEPRIEKNVADTAKPEVNETNAEKQTEKLVSMEKRVEEKSGKIVKEVTETTTLRVSHDTRFGVASYKVISNTVQDHRENVDVKEMKDLERIVLPDVHEKMNGSSHEIDSGCKSGSYSRRDELSTKTDDAERVIKFAKICEINQESRIIPVDASKDIALSLKEYTRHHEDSGIEMSPTKKDENLEGQDFLERARKIQSTGKTKEIETYLDTNLVYRFLDVKFSAEVFFAHCFTLRTIEATSIKERHERVGVIAESIHADSSNDSVLPRKRRVTRMVDGHDSMETTENSEGPREKESRTMVESNEDAPQQTTSPTTTISTIAVQSGETRLVIALLQRRHQCPGVDDFGYRSLFYMGALNFSLRVLRRGDGGRDPSSSPLPISYLRPYDTDSCLRRDPVEKEKREIRWTAQRPGPHGGGTVIFKYRLRSGTQIEGFSLALFPESVSGEWLRLKVLEVQPELTKLGATVEEATELSNAHDEVLLRLQSKQSPVEELLRQADQLISNQRPRAEVYAAMAETLGQAWRDVNELLERRKQILDSNVLFQCRAEECRESMRALEMACNDTLLPIEIEAVKNFLSKIHDLRKNMLEALMGALQEGKNLLDRLKEISNEGTLDSRPDRIKLEADHAVLKVEKWLEELHDRRRLIEASFRSRKTQLEQCLALALLATDLRDLEEILNDRIAALSSSCDQLGDSASSAELLLFELKKLQAEAKEFQDRSIKITKSTERLVSSGHFAGEQATEQAYAILGAAADYVNDLDQYESLLNRAVAFFDSARSAITKLDQLEIQLVTTEHPPYSTRLARFHAQTVATIEDVTAKPLAEGYALLDVTGRGAPGAEGVKRVVEELENRKIRLMERCTAHEKENLEISRIINTFLDKHDELRKWLMSIPEAFLQGHQDMGSDVPMAEDFCRLHRQLLNDLERRTDEVEHLEFEILPIRERLEEAQKLELQSKVEELKNSWTKTKDLVANRIDLGSLYLQFHLVVEELTREIESIESDLKRQADVLDEGKIDQLGRRWRDLQPLYVKLNNTGEAFLNAALKIDDPYLDVPRACICVKTLLEKFANRQLIVTETWEKWRTTIEILRKKRIEHERKIEESTRTMEWVSKFSEQLYPVITSQSYQTASILQDLSGSKHRILPELNKAVSELDSRIKGIDTLAQKGEVQIEEEILKRLRQMHENLRTTARDYEILLESLISIFQNIEEVEYKTEQLKIQAERVTSLKKLFEVVTLFGELDALRWSISDRHNQIRLKVQETIARIKQQEPPDAGVQDIEKLKYALESLMNDFEVFWSRTSTKIEEYRRTCTFAEDLERIDIELHDLNEHLKKVDAKIGENLQAARAVASSFVQFEKTVAILEERIETFIKMTEESIRISTPQIVNDISSLKERWRNLKRKVEDMKKKINLSIEYFILLEEAKEWNREGSKLLVVIARKATTVKLPKDAMELLQEIDNYLKPGEEIQERRIEKLKELSTIVFDTERLPQFNEVVVENRQMLDSFAVVSSELRTLAENLKNAEDLQEKLRIEKREADEKLQAAKVEMAAAEAAREEAENAKKIAEKLAAETLEKATIEAKKLKEERKTQKISAPQSFSVSAQTEKIESTDESFVKEMVTSATITKEIHILQKTEIEKTVPASEREPSPQKKIVTEETREKSVERMYKEEVPPLAPEFTLPLHDATVQEGEKFTFQCNLIGQPTPEIVWFKDGISILNNPDYLTTYVHGICTLTIEETFAEDSAKYTCRAFNIAGSAETSATLTVKETAPEEQPNPPVFIKELVPSVASEGSSYRMDCIVEGNPLPTVQWFKNDVNIDNSPDYIITYNNGEAVLKFEEVFLEDKATYTCKAVNRLGQASTSAFLNVKPAEFTSEKPYFVTPLSNAMGRAGQRVKLECEAKGSPMPTLTWYHDGRAIEETMNLKIQTDAGRTSLIISEAFAKDAGCYTVAAKNDAGEATVSCNVSVKGRLPHETSDSEFASSDMEPVVPKIQMPLKDLKVQEGLSVRLDCVIVGQPEPEVIWYHDDQPVKESADFQLLFQGDKCSLVIHEAFLDDAGVYKVVAINSGGEASSQCTLTVTPVTVSEKLNTTRPEIEETFVAGSPPKFVKLPTDSLVAEGETAIFDCAVVGEPKPELRWFSDSGEITGNDRILIQRREDGTSILRISAAIPEDKGNYVVKAFNAHGEAKAFARLVVRSLGDFRRKEEFVQMEEKLIAPTFKERFEDRRVMDGVSTKFECIVVGKPSPKIQWLFNDRPVHGKDFLVSVSGDRQVLTIPETGSTHVGTISCVAENAAGKAICSARLEIGKHLYLIATTSFSTISVNKFFF